MTKILFQNLGLLILLALFSGCGKEKDTSWGDPYNEFENNIIQYHRASQKYSIEEKSENPKVFIDFSDGLWQAYTDNPLNKQVIQVITNKLVSSNIEWFSLGNSQIEKLNYTSNKLYNTVTDPAAYKNIMAPIQEALRLITSAKNDALLITDFEEYTSNGQEQFENYPKKYFTEWLNDGNSITFFYTDYTEVNRKSNISTKKHLYFTVFTFGRATDLSIVSQVKAALEGRNFTKTFELGGHPFSISNNYSGKEGTGIASKYFQKWVKFNYNGISSNGNMFEVIGINKPWNDDFQKYIDNIIQKEDRVFLRKLLLNAKDKSYYTLKEIKIRTYNVTNDYEKFFKCFKVINNKPKFTKDKGKNKVWDKKTSSNKIITEGYEQNTDKIKDKWIYNPIESPSEEWFEVFDLDYKIFSDHLRNDPANIELITLIHQNFKYKNIKSENALLRIDLIYEDIEFNFANSTLKDFEWLSATQKNKQNTSLSEAIRNTLQDPYISPKGKSFYTYYIKFNYKTKEK